VWNAAVWLDMVQEARDGIAPIEVTWKPFSLDQINQKVGEGYQVWDEPEENIPDRLWGLRAAVAADLQGPGALNKLLPLLLKARHEDRKNLGDFDVLTEAAVTAGLDKNRFLEDLKDRSSLEAVAKSHTTAVEQLGIFGTPTFVFEDGGTAFVKLIRPDTPDEAEKDFESVMSLVENARYVGEIKRPQPPWPRGI